MDLEFFDANAYIGHPVKPITQSATDADGLIKEMDAVGISTSLIWHIVQYEASPEYGNRMINDAVAGRKRFLGCWTLLPPVTGEVIKNDFFGQMKKNRIAALRIFPEWHRFLLHRVSFGGFLDELCERNIPLMITMERPCIQWQGIYGLMMDFPHLTIILCDIGVWGVDRYTWPLLEKFPNVYLETSLLSMEVGGLESAVRKFGSERFVFGTGFPERYPESAILQLTHADISNAAKEKIASGNLKRIVKKEKL